MANKFTDGIFLNGTATIYGTNSSSVIDSILKPGSSETIIGTTESDSMTTTITSGNGVISFYSGSSSNDPALKAQITDKGKYIWQDSTQTQLGFRLSTNDSGTINEHIVLVYNTSNNITYVGSDSDACTQLYINSEYLHTPNGITMSVGKYIYGMGESSSNSIVNIIDEPSDPDRTSTISRIFMFGVNSSNVMYFNYQTHSFASDDARTSSGMMVLYGKQVRLYAGSQILLQCASTAVSVPSGVTFKLNGSTYAGSTITFTNNTTNVSSYSGNIRIFPSLKLAVMTLQVSMKKTYSANSNITIGTISDTYAPGTLQALNAVGYNGASTGVAKATAWITNAGTIYFKQRVAGSSGHTIALTGAWFYADPAADPDDI